MKGPSTHTRKRLAEAVTRTVRGQPDGFLATGRRSSLKDHFRLVKPEFAGAPLLCWLCARCIILIRRGLDQENQWASLQYLFETPEYSRVLAAHLNTRWLISVCDTYADFGNPAQRGASLSLSVLVNVIKLAETERLLMRDSAYQSEKLEAYQCGAPQSLWNGVTSYLVQSGDMPRNLFARLTAGLAAAPPLNIIGATILSRLRTTQGHLLSRLGALNPRFWE